MAVRKYAAWGKVPGKLAQKRWDKLVVDHGDGAGEELRRIIFSDPEAFKATGMWSIADYEVETILRAQYYTTVRNVGRGLPKDRREFKSFAEAIADAGNDPQVLVYGVISEINSTSLARKYWAFYTTIIAAVAERDK